MTPNLTEADIADRLSRLTGLKAAIGAAIVGQEAVVEQLLIGLIAVGVVLLLGALLAIGFAVGAAGDRSEEAAPTPAASTAAPAEPSATPTTAPTAALPTVGPLPAGSYAWTALLGGECLQPFDSVWAEQFTVVDCATAHTGEMVATGWPVLVSLSNKDFVGETLDLPVGERLTGTLAATAVCALAGALRTRSRPAARIAYPLLLAAAWVVQLFNALMHARDAWASMPGGLVLSAVGTALMVAAVWLGFHAARHGARA